MSLGVVIPYVQEWPQIAFTIRAVHNDLIDIPHEIIVVDNWCEQAYAQSLVMGKQIDRGHARIELKDKSFVPVWDDPPESSVKERHGSAIESMAEKLPWLRYIHYGDRLSHWQAKRVAVDSTTCDTLLFVDAHVVPSPGCLSEMYKYYENSWNWLHGSLHAPLTYHILEEHKLIYKLVYEKGLLGYSFTGYRDADKPYEVPVMSTCGMMIRRRFLNQIGGIPTELGIYGGGENYINGALGVTGHKKWIMPGPALHHHGDKRGYHYEWMDHKRNQALAMYIIGGRDALFEYLTHLKPFKANAQLFNDMAQDIMTKCARHHELVCRSMKCPLDEWIEKWTK